MSQDEPTCHPLALSAETTLELGVDNQLLACTVPSQGPSELVCPLVLLDVIGGPDDFL